MKCQILFSGKNYWGQSDNLYEISKTFFSGKNKKSIINLSSADSAQRLVKLNRQQISNFSLSIILSVTVNPQITIQNCRKHHSNLFSFFQDNKASFHGSCLQGSDSRYLKPYSLRKMKKYVYESCLLLL